MIPSDPLSCRVTGPRFSGGNTGQYRNKRAVGRSMCLDLTSGRQDVASPTGRSLNPAMWHVAALACSSYCVFLPRLKPGPVTRRIPLSSCIVATDSRKWRFSCTNADSRSPHTMPTSSPPKWQQVACRNSAHLTYPSLFIRRKESALSWDHMIAMI